MKALVLAAGKGKRLRPFTRDLDKSMLRIVNKPILGHIINRILTCGISDLVFVVGHGSEEIIQFIEERARSNAFKAKTIIQEVPRGTGDALNVAKREMDKENFLLVYGDLYFDEFILPEMIRRFEGGRIAGMMALVKLKETSSFGMVKVAYGRVLEIIEKDEGNRGLVNTGLYVFSSEILQELDSIKESERGEYELTSAINELVQRSNVEYIRISEASWLDVGRPWDLLKANRRALKKFERSITIGERGFIEPVLIGKGVKIGEGSIIGPYTVLEDDVQVGSRSRITQSVVMREARVGRRSMISNSLVGSSASVGDGVTTRVHSRRPISVELEGKSYDLGRRFGAIIGSRVYVQPGTVLHPGQMVVS